MREERETWSWSGRREVPSSQLQWTLIVLWKSVLLLSPEWTSIARLKSNWSISLSGDSSSIVIYVIIIIIIIIINIIIIIIITIITIIIIMLMLELSP